MYLLFEKVTEESDYLTEYVNKQSKTYKLPGPYGERTLISNSTLDTINYILKPHITIGGTAYDYNPDKYHKLDAYYFSVEELSILAQEGILEKLIPDNQSRKLKKINTIYYGSYSTNTSSSNLRDQSFEYAVTSTILLAMWIILSIFIFKATNNTIYSADFIFIRYKWANESSIIGRKLLSILLNTILLSAFASIIFSPFFIESYESNSNEFTNAMGISAYCIICIFSIWVTTSLGWWVFGKKSV